jgi:hypothetical protein
MDEECLHPSIPTPFADQIGHQIETLYVVRQLFLKMCIIAVLMSPGNGFAGTSIICRILITLFVAIL